MKFNKYILGMALAGGLTFSSCEGLIDYQPIHEDVVEDALKSVEDLEDFQLAAYHQYTSIYGSKYEAMNFLMSDNVDGTQLKSGDYAQLFRRNTDWFNGKNSDLYKETYKAIARANNVKDYFELVGVPEARQTAFESESAFLRALGHFTVVTMYGQPYGASADNSHLGIAIKTAFTVDFKPRNTVNEVYEQIISDLKFAETNLPAENNGLATSWAAKAMLAKVYLQMNDMENAFKYANDVIENGPFSLDPDFKDKFTDFSSDGSNENIFYLVSDPDRHYGGDLKTEFRDGGSGPTLRIARELYDLMPDEDLRKAQFVVANEGEETEYITLTKFETDFFDMPIAHLTEMYFIRAEAALLKASPQANVAQADLEAIMQRAYGNADLSLGTVSQAALLSELRTQKRIEMIGEGVRLQDLKRIGANEQPSLEIRGASWDCPGMVLQFPRSEFKPGFEGNDEGGC